MDYLLAGFGTGLIQAIIYNPPDRALYLTLKKTINVNEQCSTKFLHRSNWTKPFQGLKQSLLHRTLNGGLYFSIQSMMSRHTDNSLYIGLVSGTTNAVLLNQISVIKYNCWNTSHKTRNGNDLTFFESMKNLYKDGGFKIFTKGMSSTVLRDIIFCTMYETCRKKNSPAYTITIYDEMYNLGIGVFATILSSPFNYMRNIKYATPSNVKCKSNFRLLCDLIKNKNYGDLRLGWGTLRCGMGMVSGQLIYGKILSFLEQNKQK
jgi:hypothetical protein